MAQIESTQPKSPQSTSVNSILKIVLLVVFLVAAGLTAYLTYNAVRDFVAGWEMTSLPGVTIQDATPTPNEAGEVPVAEPNIPLQPAGMPTPPPWDGAKRVNLLVMGVDARDWETGQGAPRTDTMILLTLDPINRTAGMLSIPRDLWVSIPGYGYERINTAYRFGETYKYPDGGGPGLAMATVEELLGVEIDYYAQVDFFAFVRLVDEIGGVKLEIPEKIKVDPMGDNNTKTLKPGIQVLPGDLALAYARNRKTEGGDFDRAKRTQQVIMGIRDRILDFDQLPTLMAKSGVLYNELSAGVHTNLSLDQVVRLAWLASQIPEENIKQGVIWTDQVSFAATEASTGEAEAVLKPITEKIRILRDEIFAEAPVSPAASGMQLIDLMRAEGARVAVLNGSYTAGLAARTSDYLKSQGVNVVQADNAQKVTSVTEITFYNGRPYTVQFLNELMKVDPNRIYHIYQPDSPVDVSITLGDDWAANNPMPAVAGQ